MLPLSSLKMDVSFCGMDASSSEENYLDDFLGLVTPSPPQLWTEDGFVDDEDVWSTHDSSHVDPTEWVWPAFIAEPSVPESSMCMEDEAEETYCGDACVGACCITPPWSPPASCQVVCGTETTSGSDSSVCMEDDVCETYRATACIADCSVFHRGTIHS